MTVKAKAAETLEERAAKLREEMAAADAEKRRAASEAAAALRARQEAFDRELVASYDASGLDRAVADAKVALDAVVEEDPLVQAIARYFHAQSRRRHLASQLQQARNRLGQQSGFGQLPDPAYPVIVGDLVDRAVERIARRLIEAELAEMERQRDGV